MTEKLLQKQSNTDAKRKYFALPDLTLLILILCAAAIGIIGLFADGNEGELKAVVKVSGVVYEEIELSEVKEPYNLAVIGEGGENAEIYVTSDFVEFKSSPCEDKLCVNTGKLTNSGQSAVCLPLRISVELVGSDGGRNDNFPDVIVG